MGINVYFTLLLVCVFVGGLMCILMFILIRKAYLMHCSMQQFALANGRIPNDSLQQREDADVSPDQQNPQNPQDSESLQSPQSSENLQNRQSPWNTQSPDNPQNPQSPQESSQDLMKESLPVSKEDTEVYKRDEEDKYDKEESDKEKSDKDENYKGESQLSDETLSLIYQRIEEYFVNEQPFLNPSITIADVSKTLFTNRCYVSRSIRKYADKNFCQYVNYHRIKYCVDVLSVDTSLKVIELAHLSGFNSMATFNISFRAYMSISAGEWLRRNRLSAE